MADGAQDVRDIGRVINILIAAMGRPPSTDPAETVKLYVQPNLKAFKDKGDIFNTIIRGPVDFKLIPGGKIMAGGTGIVFQVQNAAAPVQYAIKFVRPTFMDNANITDQLFHVFKSEFLRHAPLSHNNVARIIGVAKFEEQREKRHPLVFEAMMMEWIHAAIPLRSHLVQIAANPSPILFTRIVDLLSQCFSALAYIHGHQIIHWDIKSDNFLVSNGVVKLTDFGNARIRSYKDREKVVFTTEGNFPPGLDGYLTELDETGSSNRVRIDLPNENWDCPWLDMWMLARELMEVLRKETGEPYEVSRTFKPQADASHVRTRAIENIGKANWDRNEYLLECLRTILRRILVPLSPDANRFYQRSEDVIADLAKLEPEFGASQNVAELWAVPQKITRLPIAGNIPFPNRIRKIFDTRLVDRLSQHLQLGGVYQVYRGGHHTRTEHMAGVLAATCDYVRALFADRSNVYWRLSIERRDIDVLLFCALVHDIGHIAFGHFVEEMEGIVADRKHENYLLAVLDPNRFTSTWANSEDVQVDRDILLQAVQQDWGPTNLEEAKQFLRDAAQLLHPDDPDRDFVEADIYDFDLCAQTKIYILNSILDSAIDADKLDYLFRDAHHCGVPYAFAIDYERFFQSLTAISHFSKLQNSNRTGHRPCIGVTRKGVQPLESILVARYHMFQAVYWQHTARSQTCMLQFLITEYLRHLGKEASGVPVPAEIRIDTLISEFRNRSDEGAIGWLRSQVQALEIDSRLKARLDNIAKCLLSIRSRDYLYREVFALTYEKEQEVQLSKIYKSLSDWSKSANESATTSDYLSTVQKLREYITETLSAKLKISLEYGDVLLDIPPAGKDQVEEVYVDFGDRIKPIYNVSPLGDAVKDIFAKWTRSVRLFMDAGAISRWLESGGTRRDLESACLEVLRNGLKDEWTRA